MAEKHDVCLLLDKLTLEMLKLMEEKVQCEVNIENATSNASIHLAKSRYIMGQQTVSTAQLPTENTPEFSALTSINKTSNSEGICKEEFNLIQNPVDLETHHVNPLKWFGILVPQNLHQAQNLFKSVLDYVVECVNVQERLKTTCKTISHLRLLKHQLTAET